MLRLMPVDWPISPHLPPSSPSSKLSKEVIPPSRADRCVPCHTSRSILTLLQAIAQGQDPSHPTVLALGPVHLHSFAPPAPPCQTPPSSEPYWPSRAFSHLLAPFPAFLHLCGSPHGSCGPLKPSHSPPWPSCAFSHLPVASLASSWPSHAAMCLWSFQDLLTICGLYILCNLLFCSIFYTYFNNNKI